MKNFRFRLQAMCLMLMLGIVTAAAQSNIRYVTQNGAGNKDGSSWDNAYANVQDAIDAVNTAGGGEVWVAEGTYYPTGNVGTSGSTYDKAFVIPGGVTVRGGFAGTETALNQRIVKSDKNFGKVTEGALGDGVDEARKGVYKYKTILCGDPSASQKSKMVWNSTKQQFDVTFYGNSYHVVWFATNGFATNGRANGLTKAAKLEGCIVEGGHAYTSSSAAHPHEGYGGGIYMVANTEVKNCEVRKCDATRSGGGIYMDGGGVVRRTYVHNCQALGVGTEYGMGGGIFEDGNTSNTKSNPIVVAQSVVTNCVGRLGGGMALSGENATGNGGKDKYSIVANSTIVNNNTASMEAGGVYTYKGGGLASMTIVNNKCNGSGIVQNNVTTGRSGGVYSRDAAYIGNTVIWGNECAANDNIQYASSHSSLSDTEKTKFYYNALSNSGIADWSMAEKLGVLSLESTNTNEGTKSSSKGFPLFFKPTPLAGYYENIDETFDTSDENRKEYNWEVSSESFLSYAGIATIDLDQEGLTPAPEKNIDMQYGEFNSRPSIGALISQVSDIAPATNVTYDGVTYDEAYYVDPSFIYPDDNPGSDGNSWDTPARFLGNVLDHIGTTSNKVVVFVKEGTVNNVRANSAGSTRIRTTSLDIPSNVTLIGSFDKKLEGQDVSKRNPILTPTIISAKLLKDYKYNIAHIIKIEGKQNITIDGFKLTFANANSIELGNTDQNGAAITIKNSNTDIKFKNIIVSNCYANNGTVVYAYASTASFENCIFHNNTTETVNNATGLIYGTQNSNLSFDHCNVLRSVGHASYLDATTTNNWKNSMFYGNLDRKQDNTNNCDEYAIPAFEGAGVNSTNLTGERCMFDRKSRPLYDNRDPQYETKGLGVNLGANIPGNSTYYVRTTGKDATTTETNPNGLEYAYTSGWANGYPRMVNPTKNAGYSVDGDVTYYGRATSFEPHNDNPVINAASTNGNPHNSALPSDEWGRDITAVTTRDFGGLPDIGAVESKFVPAGTDDENANPDGQPEYGRAMYVRDYRNNDGTVDYTAGGSGMSWQEAINGNAYYTADGENHHSDKDATIEKDEEYDETIYSEGAAARITDAATQNTGVLLKNTNGRYLAYNGSALTLTQNVAQATLFKIATTSNNGYTITAIYEGNNIAIGYTSTDKNARLAYGNNATYKTWYRNTKTNTSSNFANKASGNNIRYIYSTTGTSVSLSSNSMVYSYYNRNKTTERRTRKITVKAVNGLQYAVNSRYQDYTDQGMSGNKGVYVGAGTYTNATPKDAESVEQPYAYMMKEGVDVYGGFPSIGNPGMDQREPKKFETILQAQTGNPFVTLGEHKVYSGSGKEGKYAFVPTAWGANAGSTDGSEQASVGRVLVQPTDFNVKTTWDGFTLQHGYLHTARMHNIGSAIQNLNTTNLMTAGGAGALIQNNGVLTNCNVKENLLLCYPNGSQMTKTGEDQNKTVDTYYYTYLLGGAGVFMTGNDAVVENSQIFDNQILTKQYMRRNDNGYIPDNLWMLGAGLYQDNGQVYNTIIHDNTAATIKGSADNNSKAGNTVNNEMVLGAGAFIASGYFYNNTIVNNQSATIYHCHNNHCTFAGVHVKNGATIYNSIIADNTSHFGYEAYYQDKPNDPNLPGNGIPVSAFKDDASSRDSRDQTKVHVSYSYIDVNRVATDKTVDTNGRDLVSWNDTEHTNIYLNRAQYAASNTADDTYTSDKIYYKNGAVGTTAENIYHLKMATAETSASPAINAGRSPIPNVIIPDYDASYDDRIQDCKIDMGAYESDGRANIHPQVGNQLVFYVTPEGYGRTDGSDPENAACAPKLQMVIDAAGRYKVQNPTKQVIVKVANSYSDYISETADFTYYATRTTDEGSTDTRLWSIQIPRGVEVWGGYTDVASDKTKTSWTNANNGFQTRDITKNPTFFDSYFYNKDMKINATTYHVVTFTERIYDKDGKPYLKTDFTSRTLPEFSSYNGSQREENEFLHMKDYVSGNVITVDGNVVSNRAVLDGIFVTGGNADGKALSGTTNLNANGYGGAAIVTDYAYVRNCVVKNNSATSGGGLALTDHALVSGSLIIENNANDMGGGLYVFENGAVLSNGITVNTKADNSDSSMDAKMAHVLTSTIAGNTAEQGGGVWYTNDSEANARFNSVAIWQNEAVDQSNVFGMVNPEQPTEDETIAEIFYPFAYSLIQNVRASGTNNLSAENLNSQGVRFVDENHDVGQTNFDQLDMAKENEDADRLMDKLDNFGFYGLTKYSILCSNGMPVSYYNRLKNEIAISDVDLLNTNRITAGNGFVEIGARALALEMPKHQLMLRLFVAEPKYVDTNTADRFMRLNGTSGAAQYYSQMGSSFAYPFNSLQDALDYIKMARNGEIISGNTDAQNLPFEIIVGKGTYYPKKDLNGKTESVWAATYAIPEGVTIIGGFNPVGGVSTGNTTYYGRYYQKGTGYNTTTNGSIDKNVDPIPTSVQRAAKGEIGRGYNSGNETVHLPATADGKPAMDITFQQWHIQDIADRRAMNDNNKNGIIEPWEFANQTIISGNAVNGETDGVYHVMTAVADEDAVGNMPKVQEINEEFVGSSVSEETGYQWKEKGQQIRLNGLIVTGGNALTYLSTALDEYGKYIFYQGAGLQVDGNRYKNNSGSTAVFHNSAAYGVGYRDIPVSVTNCQFRNNIAGYGGAISTNGSLSLFGSSFEQNIAVAQTETAKAGDDWKDINGNAITEVNYPGQGGAILATRQLSAFNTLFANNEARYADAKYTATVPTSASDLFSHKSFRVPSGAAGTLRAAGGAIMMGSAAEHHIVNCDFVRNKANAYPAVFTMNPTFDQTKPGIDTHDYSQIINTVAWGNEVNAISSNADYLRASKLMVNIGKKDRTTYYIKDKSSTDFYDPSFAAANVPSAADLTSTNAESTTWQEAVWFCAYEDGVGFKPNNTNDLRTKIVYTPTAYAPTMIKDANAEVYQNCNILIVADNGHADGPAFGNPSMKAGYDGYMESADWSPARLNKLTDQGNGWIKQTVDNATLDVTFHNDEDGDGNYQGAYSVTHYIEKVIDAQQFPEYKLWLAIGNEKYMESTTETEAENVYINNTNIGRPQKNLPRISPDPEVGVDKAYIDIGVYEYIKRPLLKPGSEVDIIWVASTLSTLQTEGDGSSWNKPTTNLQGAIETVLRSRNGHKKEVRLMDGVYAPQIKTVNDVEYSALVIDTKSLNGSAITPSTFSDGKNNNEYYAQAITIKGGYSKDNMYDYDPVKYKTTIQQVASDKNTDYLIYIVDPTVRYAGTSTSTGNDQATFGSYGESTQVKTMPIQIDGVTLINDQAKSGVQGSAIYYPDYEGDSAPQANVAGSHSVSVGGEVVYYESKEEMEKVDSDGKHIGQTVDHVTDFPLILDNTSETLTDPAKILITKTQVIGSGNKTSDNPTTASAVYIGKNGGPALIYNAVFHSNYGMPLDAWNTINVNNTFGKNAGQIRLQDSEAVSVKSQMHNSVMWENNGGEGNAQFSIPDVTVDAYGNTGATCANFTYNSFSGGNTLYTGDSDMATNLYNTGLIANNSDLMNGPNFVDPDNTTIESRNFDIRPSVRLLNQGMDTSLEPIGNPDVNNGNYYTLVVNNKYDFSLTATTDKDIAGRDRLKSPRIDIGAYEFQGSLRSILYVDPNKNHKNDATGENWDEDKVYGFSDLQNAVDLAALAHLTDPTQEAYVFVKGNTSSNPNRNTGETITLRDGVTVYGSINADDNNWHEIMLSDGVTPKYNNVKEYIEDMKQTREGVASNRASKTIVTGIKTSEYTEFDDKDNNTPVVVDGFVVTNPDPQSTPVVDITNDSENAIIALSNIVVADNTMTDGADVARISNGLLYEALIRDNATTGAALRVSNTEKTKGYAVNVTVEGKTVGADNSEPVDGNASAEAEKNAQIFKSITNSINSGTGSNAAGGEAPYKTVQNKGISGYYYNIADPNLNYQLTETSKYIDMCDAVNPMIGIAPNLVQFINYATDRDILGNPRWLQNVSTETDGTIDRGAFETWRVDNDFFCGTHGTNSGNPIAAHFYPHDGSVVYVMENKSLVIDAVDEYEVNASAENPGYLLIKKGASFYGNGRPVTAAYVAVEREVRKGGSIVAVPYAMDYSKASSVAKVGNTANDGTGDLVLDGKTGRANKYSSEERMDWKYIFQTTDTKCWDQISNAAANQGVLFEPNGEWYASSDDDNATALLRFTSKGVDIAGYIYTETGASKSVTLTKNDDAESTNNGADYTDELDMSWNCFGIPYLVSEYKPYEKATTDEHGEANNGKYMMNIPHTLWLYYDGKVKDDKQVAPDGHAVNGDGGYYSVKSWTSADADWHVATDAEKSLWVGEGIFTQTATLDDTESLVFYRPVAPELGAESSAKGVRYYFEGAGIEEVENTTGAELVATEYYTTDGARISRPRRGAVVIIKNVYSDGAVKTSKQYVK